MNPRLSVVISAYNAESIVGEAVRAIVTQLLPRDTYECIVVDDGSCDRTAEIAERAGAIVIRLQKNQGIGAARNAGVERARGEWIAFTDADCVASRRWLLTLLAAAQTTDRSTLGLAGKTMGLDSNTPAARFMDLIGALDAEVYLRSEAMPWAPGCNLVCRRTDLLAVGGYDPIFRSYETAELQWRLGERFGGRITYVPTAIVMHRHRPTWRTLWIQQRNYGYGYAQFLLRHADRWPWSAGREAGAWLRLFILAAQAATAGGEQGLVRRGLLVKHLAQRIGFASTYFSLRERRHVNKPKTRA